MKGQIKSITIPKPCTENWNNMRLDDIGRYCLNCQKSVIDFSALSNNEILSILSASTNVCGKFGDSQLAGLNSQLSVQQSSFWWKRFSLAAVFVGAFPMFKMNAQVKPPIVQHQTPALRIINTLGQYLTELDGKVIDSVSKQPIINAIIVVKGTNNMAFSDNSGFFKLKGLTPGSTIECNYFGHTAKEIGINEIGPFFTIELKPTKLPLLALDEQLLQGIIGGLAVEVNDKKGDETKRLIRQIFAW